MNVGVVGCREFIDYDYLSRILDLFVKRFNITKIISGGARGADKMAVKYAKKKGLSWKEHLPNKKHGFPAALFIRNQLIVNDSEMLIAFWDEKSTGTLDSIEKARKKKIKVYIINVETS